jgi:hypothetical protein
VAFRSLLLTVVAAFLLTGCDEDLVDALLAPDPVIYVDNRSYPGVFDPYYNQPKIYRQPRYYESTSKKTKGNKVFKTTTVKDEYGQTVYKNTTSHKKKKKNSPPEISFLSLHPAAPNAFIRFDFTPSTRRRISKVLHHSPNKLGRNLTSTEECWLLGKTTGFKRDAKLKPGIST